MTSVLRYAALATAIVATVACSGNFSTGTQPNAMPPANPTLAPNASSTAANKVHGTAPPAAPGAAVYPLTEAQNGFACPETSDGFSCTLRFNLPPATPTPSTAPGAKRPTPAPTATPTLAPTSGPGSEATASPTPAGPTITLHAAALPTDAPKMVHIPKNVTNAIALMTVTLTTSDNFPLNGLATAAFTMPKEQFAPNRGYALQLFVQRMQGKTKAYAPLISLDKGSLEKNTLTYGFTPPKMTVAKNTTYVLVLYATEIGPAPSLSP